MPTIIPLIIKFGIPAGIEGARFLVELIEKWNNKPGMTQAELDAEWAEMQARYLAAGAEWEAAG